MRNSTDSATSPSTFTVVIPALNEEEAIGQTIERCLAARVSLENAFPGLHTTIVVVSDGSDDGTVSIAQSYPEVDVLIFEKNRGYGAAIKAGFRHGGGDLVGFLDADGTCDPEFFVNLVGAITSGADVALGSRMGPNSKMPKLRRLGNRIFATILSILSRRAVGDSASGMRVIRKDVLSRLDPLPDGLHYTPAMSARALLRKDIEIVELPMEYSERLGESKLSPAKDGVRFLRVILATVLALRPARLLLLASLPGLAAAGLVGSMPVSHYIQHRMLEDWMMYRLLLASLLGAVGAQLVFGAAVAEKIAALADQRDAARSGITGLLRPLFSPVFNGAAALILFVMAGWVVAPGVVELFDSGQVTLHWSRAVLGALLATWGTGVLVTSILLVVIQLSSGVSQVLDRRPADAVRLGSRST